MPSDDPSSSRAARPSLLSRLIAAFREDADPDSAAAQPANGALDLVAEAQAFQSLRVSDVMTPRADILALEINSSFDEVVARFADAEHSRMPIYRETLDEPVGLVHIKDIFKLLAARTGAPPDRPLRKLRREALYVPASMRAADLMLQMQAKRVHLALVIDEHGGTDGLVTLEDLIEAVVGDIDDEHDEASPQVQARPGGVYEADARAPLEDLEALLDKELTPADLEEEIDTVGGLVSAVAGRVPQRGEVIAHPLGYDFEVIDADPRRVKRVRVRPSKAAEPQPSPDFLA